ncbi:MAG: hypothetical protein ACT4OP_10500 [Actinomycetota bacterium]
MADATVVVAALVDDGPEGMALRDLLGMPIDLSPFQPLAERIWECAST